MGKDAIMKILAVDYGASRTGLATCDVSEFLTTAITPQITLKARPKVAARVCEIAAEIHAELIVVGLPLKSLLFDDTIPVDVHVEIPAHGVNAALSGTLEAGVNSLSAPISVISDSDIDSIVQLRERLEQFADLINTALKRVQ